MKVIAINGSPHPQGNTFQALKVIGEELKNENIEFEILQVGSQKIHGCMGCNMCFKNHNERCVITTDTLNDLLQKIKDVDGLILGSPVHYSGIAGTMKCFLDRTFYVAGANGNWFRHKVGTAIVAVIQDNEGLQIMRTLGRNMAWLMKMREQTKDTLTPPEGEKKIMTNFIR